MRETAILVFASDEERQAEISDSVVDLPLSVHENEPITSDDNGDDEGETTRPRQSQLRRRHDVNSFARLTALWKKISTNCQTRRMNVFQS